MNNAFYILKTTCTKIEQMKALKRKTVRLLGKIPICVPDWIKTILRPFSGIYSKVYREIYSSIKEEELIKTPVGPYIYVRYWDHIERECAVGSYERKYMDIFCSKIREGDIVIDVGAYIGIFSLVASKRVGPKGCIYSFEPVPISYERLMRNIKINKAQNIKAYNWGLSNRNEILPINVPRKIPGEATLCQTSATEIYRGIKVQKDVIEISLKPFDTFYNEECLNKVNIVKIDAEGEELKILRGMKYVLKSNDLILFIEINPYLIKNSGGSIEELMKILYNSGFKYIYSHKLNLKIEININNINNIIKFIDKGGNFIINKKEM